MGVTKFLNNLAHALFEHGFHLATRIYFLPLLGPLGASEIHTNIANTSFSHHKERLDTSRCTSGFGCVAV
jgi:hypothetical protein